jgi:hypothetical protein
MNHLHFETVSLCNLMSRPPINSSVKGWGGKRSKRAVEIKSGSELAYSEPFFVGSF